MSTNISLVRTRTEIEAKAETNIEGRIRQQPQSLLAATLWLDINIELCSGAKRVPADSLASYGSHYDKL